MGLRSNVIDQLLSSPRNQWMVAIEDIKDLYKDYPDLQDFFIGLISDEDYERCLAKACMDFNFALPQTQYNLVMFPDPYLLMKKAFYEVLCVLEAYHASNYFTGSSGGVNVPIHERFQALAPLKAQLKQDNDERQKNLKIQLNYLSAFGGTDQFLGLGIYGTNYGY